MRWGKIGGGGGFPKSFGGVNGEPPSWMGGGGMIFCSVEVPCFFLSQFLIILANFEIPVSTCEVTEDFKQKKEEKGKKRGDFFLFCAPLPLTTKVKIGGGGQERRKIGGGGVIFWWHTL